MDLHDELCELEKETSAGRRGRRFEVFLVHLLEKESFSVVHNPKTARPRQTDLVASREKTFFLVEAKCTKRKTGIADITEVRDRLARVPHDMFACVFSLRGFTDSALEEVCRDKGREIYLFNETEIRGLVEGNIAFHKLLEEKKEFFRIHGLPLLSEVLPVPIRFQIRLEPDVFQVGSEPLTWLRSRTGHNDIIFSNDLLSLNGNFRNSVFSLELHPSVETIRDLKRVYGLLQNWIPISGQGSFSIHQSGEGWFGFGFESFLSAIVHQEKRYKELNWETYHHSEELAYFDRLENGGVICLTSRQGTGSGQSYLHSTHLEIYFPGIPVDGSSVRRLSEAMKDTEARFELVGDNPVKSCRLSNAIEVQPVRAIVSNWHGERSVSGIVVKNPLVRTTVPEDNRDDFASFWGLIAKSEFLFCSLRHWHGSSALMKNYRLTAIEACWIERFCTFHILCDWN
jgi:Restriction endonuclease